MVAFLLLLALQDQKDYSAYIPGPPYTIGGTINACFVKAPARNTAILAVAQKSDADPSGYKHLGPVLVVIDDHGKVLWKKKSIEAGVPDLDQNGTLGLNEIDVKEDSEHELVWVTQTVGASGGYQNVRIIGSVKGKLHDLLYPAKGGLHVSNPAVVFSDTRENYLTVGYAVRNPKDANKSNADARYDWYKDTLRFNGTQFVLKSTTKLPWPKSWKPDDLKSNLKVRRAGQLIAWFYL